MLYSFRFWSFTSISCHTKFYAKKSTNLSKEHRCKVEKQRIIKIICLSQFQQQNISRKCNHQANNMNNQGSINLNVLNIINGADRRTMPRMPSVLFVTIHHDALVPYTVSNASFTTQNELLTTVLHLNYHAACYVTDFPLIFCFHCTTLVNNA